MPKSSHELEQSWWARRWLSFMESLGEEEASRLARGRAYARRGSVLRHTVQPGEATALVQGSYMETYTVRLRQAVFPDGVWNAALKTLAEQPALAAGLLARNLPSDLEALFNDLGVSLFPVSPREIEASCTCPDWAPICKHIAATMYTLAERMDADPFVLLALRGRTEAAITGTLRAHWSDRTHQAPESVPMEPTEETAATPRTEPLRVEDFYTAGPQLDDFRLTITPPPVETALLARIGKPPFAGEHEDALTPLASAYTAVTQRALRTLRRGGMRAVLVGDDGE